MGLSTLEFYALPAREQALQVAAWQEDRTKCPQCGGRPEECGDAERPWYPQMTVCHATRETAAANAAYQRLHDDRPWHDGSFQRWAEKPSAEFPYPADAGVSIWVSASDLGLGGDFLQHSR